MRILLHDLQYTVRCLRKRPLYSAVVVLTLAVGIAALTAVASLVNKVMLQPFGPIDGDRWVYVWEHRTKSQSLNQISPSIPNFRDWQAGTANVFAQMVVWLPWSYTASGPGLSDPERVRAAVISPDLFSGIAASPAAGRWLNHQDADSGERRVVLSFGFWKRAYGADPALPGKTIRLNGAPHTVVGIAPPGFAFPPEDQVDVWTVLPASVLASSERAARGYRVAAMLQPGITVHNAQAALNVIARRLSDQYVEDRDYDTVVIPMREGVVGDFRSPLIALSGAVGFAFVLLCVNIGYLRLVHLEARSQEIAVRLALGARRVVLVRQLLIETLLLFTAGGGLGVLLAPVGVRLLLSYVPAAEIPWLQSGINGVALAAAIGFTTAAALFSGLLPMIRTLRADLARGLTVGAAMKSPGERGRLPRTIIATQIAIAFIPLCGASLLMQSFVRLQEVKLGFDSPHRMTLALSAPKGRYPGPAEITALANQIRESTRGIPGVKQQGLAQAIPFAPGARWLQAISRSDPKNIPGIASLPLVRYSVVTPGYFEAMGIPLRAGRLVADSDTRSAQPVVVINEKLARLYFPSQNPIGKLLWIGHAESLAESAPRVIAGVVGDTPMYALDQDPDPAAWVPMAQQSASDSIWRNLFLVADVQGDPGQVASALRECIKRVDPDMATADVSWMTTRVSDSLWRQRLSSSVLASFSLAAVGIALLGVFGVTSYLVARRSREIGIRMALGANPKDIWKLVLTHNLVQVSTGIAFGIAGSIALTRFLQGLLFGVRPADPLTLAAVAAALACAALVASLVPAHRAARSEPLSALHTE